MVPCWASTNPGSTCKRQFAYVVLIGSAGQNPVGLLEDAKQPEQEPVFACCWDAQDSKASQYSLAECNVRIKGPQHGKMTYVCIKCKLQHESAHSAKVSLAVMLPGRQLPQNQSLLQKLLVSDLGHLYTIASLQSGLNSSEHIALQLS